MVGLTSLRLAESRLSIFSTVMSMVRWHEDGVVAVAPGHEVGHEIERFFARETIEQSLGHQRNR